MLQNGKNERLVKLSPLVREAIALAETERAIAGHQCLTTGHLLLGVLRTGTEPINILYSHGITLEHTRMLVHAAIRYGTLEKCSRGWSRKLGHLIHEFSIRVGDEQAKSDYKILVIQLIEQPECISSQILASLGVTEEGFQQGTN